MMKNNPFTTNMIKLQRVASILLFSALAHATPSVQVTAPLPSVDADLLMTWAEQTYPDYFPRNQATTKSLIQSSQPQPFVYRAYGVGEKTNYLAVTTGDSTVWVMGDLTQAKAVSVGNLSDFSPFVYPGRGVSNSHVPGSLQARYFAEINDARIRGGFGQIEQDTRLDTAAQNHANYFGMAFSSSTGDFDESKYAAQCSHSLCAHEETMGLPFATGTYSEDRAKAAGWPYRIGVGAEAGVVSEVIGFGSVNNPKGISGLLDTVYHRNGILDPRYTHVGIGVAPSVNDKTAEPNFATIVNPAYNVPRVMPDGWIGVYPGDGAHNVPTVMGGEVPNPAPEFSVIGYPVSIHLVPTVGSKLAQYSTILKKPIFTITTFILTAPDGSVVHGKVMNGETTGLIGVGNIFFLPSVALAKNTTYTVHFLGQENGVTNMKASWPASNPIDITWTYQPLVVRTIEKTWAFTTQN